MKKDPGNNLKKAQKINLGSSPFTFKNKVDKQDRDDIFRFRVRRSSDLSAELSKLNGNADLELYSLKKKKGKVLKDIGKIDFNTLKRKDIKQNLVRITRSNNKGKNAENIQQRIEPGQYYIRVLSKKGEGAKYRLKVSAAEPAFQQLWIDQFGSAEDDEVWAIAPDKTDGSIYLAGKIDGAFLETIANPTKESDAFVAKYTSNGDVDWFNTLSREGRDGILHLELDTKGNIYGLGNANFIPAIGFESSESDPYFVRYNRNGDLLIEKILENTEAEIALGLKLDNADDILAFTQRASVSAATPTDVSLEYSQLIYQYTSSGGVQFQKNLDSFRQSFSDPSPQPIPIPAEAVEDNDGNIYLVGGIIGPLISSDLRSLENAFNGFIAKYDINGRQLWQNTISSAEADLAGAITVDANGNVYVVGTTTGSLPGNSSNGQDDAFLAKYSSNGIPLWIQQFGTLGTEEAIDVAIDDSGNIYVVGSTTEDLFGHENLGERDGWLAKWDSNGNILDSVRIGTPEEDLATRLTIDVNGDIYVTGTTEGDLGGANQGGIDAWMAKYTPPA